MTEKSAYEEHIEHTFNAYCMIVIRHAAIDAGRTLRQKWRQEWHGRKFCVGEIRQSQEWRCGNRAKFDEPSPWRPQFRERAAVCAPQA